MSIEDHPHLYRARQLVEEAREIVRKEYRQAGAGRPLLEDAYSRLSHAERDILAAAQAEDMDE